MECYKILLLLGVILMNCPISMIFIYGNLVSYIISVFYSWDHYDDRWDIDPSWMISVLLASYVIGMFVIDVMKRRIGLRFTLLSGIILYLIGKILTFYTVQHSVWATTLTFMFISNIGDGLIVGISLIYIACGFKESVGMASSVTIASSAVGGIIMNQIITQYSNPDNLSPNAYKGEIAYFTQISIITKVPTTFLLIGAISGAAVFLGFGCLSAALKLSPEIIMQADEILLERAKLKETDEESDKSTIQVLKSKTFYILWFSAFSEIICCLVDVNYCKLFGQNWIDDDDFMANIESSSAIVSFVFQIGCGYCIDRFGDKNTLITHLALTSVFMSLWYFTAMSSKWLYYVWTNILQSVDYNQYILFPVIALNTFGKKYYATNLGLILTATLCASSIAPPIINTVLSSLGWFWLFLLCAFLTSLSAIFCCWRFV